MAGVRIWKGFDFDLIGTECCYILGFYRANIKLIQEPAPNSAGVIISPGDVLMNLGGKKTSAGFTHIWFDPGGGLCYRGIHAGLDGKFVCFDQLKNGKVIEASCQEYKRLYFAYQLMDIDPPCWFHTNHAVAGRIVETTVIERIKAAGTD